MPLGLAGAVLGTACGTAAVPAFYTVNSTVKGSAEFAGGAVVGPVIGYAWNTVEGEGCLVRTALGHIVSGTILPIKASIHIHGKEVGDLPRTDENTLAWKFKPK